MFLRKRSVREWLSKLPRTVSVRPVFDSKDSNLPDADVGTTDHPVVTAPSAVKPAETEPERLADPVRIRGEGAVQELHY
jgi:hypothetical protein